MHPSPQTAASAVNVEEVMREIRERVRRKRLEGGLPDPGAWSGASLSDFAVPKPDRISAAWVAIGRKPPAPNTLRGRAGALAIAVFQRLLFWYTTPIASAGQALQETFAEYSATLERIVSSAEAARAELSGRLDALAAAQEEHQQRRDAAERRADAAEQASQQLRSEVEDLRRQLGEAHAVAAAARQQAHESGHRLEEVRAELADARREFAGELLRLKAQVAVQDRRLAVVLEEARKRLPAPFDQPQLEVLADEARGRLEALYCSFEDRFRGSREDIRERLAVYLPYVRQALAARAEPAVLDLGCGRGEWLELLRDQGIPARGVDSNTTVVADCRARGLNVLAADGLRHLASLPDASLDVLSAFHVIEHLPWEAFITLLDEAVRVLRSGGALILETPNPENVLVGANNFYFDPTHRKPMPAGMTRFMVEARGLCRVETLFLHAYPDASRVAGDSELCRRFNQFFYGPQDYAVLGYKA